jgi:hypothetical protein
MSGILEASRPQGRPHPGTPMMGDEEIATWKDLQQWIDETLGNLPLSSPELMTILDRSVERERSLEGSGFVFRGATHLEVTVLNDPSDRDPDGIVGIAPKRENREKLPPQIELEDASAILRYRIAGELAARARGKARPAGWALDGRSGVELLDYRRHPADRKLLDAIDEDLANPRSVLVPRNIGNVAPGEALALVTRASLRASVTLLWIDIWSNVLTRLSAILEGRAPVALRVDSRATVTVPLTVDDQFLLAFSVTEGRETRIAVKRAARHGRGMKLRVYSGAKIGRSKQVAAGVVDLLGGFFDAPLATLRKILAKATLDELDEEEREIVERLAEQLGLSEELESLRELRQLVESIEERATEAVAEVLGQMVATSFEYEYSRIEENDDLLSVVIRREGIDDRQYEQLVRRHHRELIGGDLDGLTTAIREDSRDRYRLERWLNLDRIVSTSSFGFTLGVGPWKASVKEVRKLEQVTRTDIEGRRTIRYLGTRRHQTRGGAFGGMEWYVDFRAGMNDWSVEPVVADFEFGLHFHVVWKIERFTEKRLLPLLDMATLWGALGPDDTRWAIDQAGQVLGTRGVTVRLQTVFEEDHLRRILPLVGRDDAGRMAAMLAAALPYWEKYALLRHHEARAIAYRDLVREALEGRAMSVPEWSRAAARTAERMGERRLAEIERRMATGGGTFANAPGSVIHLHRKLPYAWHRFLEGARLFSEALTGGTMHHARVPEIFRELRHFWEQAWYFRALPAYLLALAEEKETAVGVQRVLRIDYQSDDRKRSLHLTRARRSS